MQVPDILNFKIILVGHQGVGKSSLVTRYVKGEFLQNYNVTVGVQYSTKMINLSGKQIRLQIWDTAGQQLFRSLVKSFYRGISAVFFVYSIDNAEAFEELQSWSKEVKEYAHQEAVMFVIGAKADFQERRQVSTHEASNFLKTISGAFFIETSAKTGLNVQLLFKRAAQILQQKYQSNPQFKRLVSPNDFSAQRGRQDSIVLRRSTLQSLKQIKTKKKCCEK